MASKEDIDKMKAEFKMERDSLTTTFVNKTDRERIDTSIKTQVNRHIHTKHTQKQAQLIITKYYT